MLIVGSFLIFVGKFWQVLKEIHIWLGVLIVWVIALPWYILVTLFNGDAFINSFFSYRNIERFTRVVNNHWAPWYFYFVVLVGTAPWSVYLPLALAGCSFGSGDNGAVNHVSINWVYLRWSGLLETSAFLRSPLLSYQATYYR